MTCTPRFVRDWLAVPVTAVVLACGASVPSLPGSSDDTDAAATESDSGAPGDGNGDGDEGSGDVDEVTSGGSADPTSGSDAGSDAGDGSGGPPGEAFVPDGVLFFDGFDYPVDREASGKFGPGGAFGEHGWSWGKDAVMNGPGAGGWLYTTEAIPESTAALPGVGSTHVLCVESKAGTYANVIDGIWRQTDFYLQYGDVEGGALDTIPADVWIQQWVYVADTASQPSLFPPTNRLGKWFYPTRNGYPSTDLEWLFGFSGVLIDSEIVEGGASAQVDIGFTSLASDLSLTDADGSVFTDGRPDGTGTLGHSGTDPDYHTAIPANAWWLVRVHVDHTVDPGVAEVWVRPYGGAWIKTVDSLSSPVVQWNPANTTDGHRGLRFPTTMSNWYQNPEGQTTHGDWWIYIDDFAIAAGEHAGGGGELDLPHYPW